MGELIRQVEKCLAGLGTEAFAPAFSEFAETLGSDQIMVFSIDDRKARCLLSRHFKNASMAEKLASKYLDGWYLQDPLLPELQQMPKNAVALRRLDDIEALMSDEYRRTFFEVPGMVAKTTLLAAGEHLRLFVSLYQTSEPEYACDADLARLAGRLALLHFSRISESKVPVPLAVLSEREQAVCLGVLSGQKAEIIAGNLGVAPSTVVTYRKRAYQKLGVTSRAGLFAICGK